ncbi:hypothetical protein GCM10027091_16220 [Streptomyces daliensis]
MAAGGSEGAGVTEGAGAASAVPLRGPNEAATSSASTAPPSLLRLRVPRWVFRISCILPLVVSDSGRKSCRAAALDAYPGSGIR